MLSKRRIRGLLAGLLPPLALGAACAPEQPAQQSLGEFVLDSTEMVSLPRPVNACELVPTEDVERIVGEPVAEPTFTESGSLDGFSYYTVCTYETMGDGSVRTIAISVRGAPEVTDPLQAMDRHLRDMALQVDSSYAPVSVPVSDGVAIWEPSLGQIVTYLPGFTLVVSAVDPTASRGLEAARLLTEIALSRMP